MFHNMFGDMQPQPSVFSNGKQLFLPISRLHFGSVAIINVSPLAVSNCRAMAALMMTLMLEVFRGINLKLNCTIF